MNAEVGRCGDNRLFENAKARKGENAKGTGEERGIKRDENGFDYWRLARSGLGVGARPRWTRLEFTD
jgi:hypothetical protein